MRKKKDELSNAQINNINKKNKKISGNINQLLDKLHFQAFGRLPNMDIERLDNTFNNILGNELNNMKTQMDGDTTSFLNRLISNDQKDSIAIELDNMFSNKNTNITNFITEAYKNKLLKFADLHEISSQLIELHEAILITRDAITSADIVDGHISRSLSFSNSGSDQNSEYISTLENMEKKFKLKERTKNFIIPNALEAGEYYVHLMPYSKIFNDFSTFKKSDEGKYIRYENTDIDNYNNSKYEKYIYESTEDEKDFTEELFDGLSDELKEICFNDDMTDDSIKHGIKQMVNNISIIDENHNIPMGESMGSIAYLYGDMYDNEENEKKKLTTEKTNTFRTVMQNIDDGVKSTKEKKTTNEYDEIKDCYIEWLYPTHVIPIKILNNIIGYIIIHDEEAASVDTALTSTMFSTMDTGIGNTEKNFIDKLSEKIVKSFDKKFLNENIKFKNLIADAIRYYNLNERKVKFQFVSKEYMVRFAINEDENGDGRSMIEPSLFYAKLYLMLLLFKMMSIVNNSNDTMINYIKSSGIDKNTANKVQAIARKWQERQINIFDMFSYTSIVNKVGQGTKIFMPTGRNDQRPIETEIASGQDVQLNTDIMEMLKTSYISGTGVPSVIMNYINESDFAKTLELANTRYQGRVVSYQLDFNPSLTELYQKLAKFTTNIPEQIREHLVYTLAAPKYSNQTASIELLNNFNSLCEFYAGMYFESKVTENTDKYGELLRSFKLRLAKEKLPMLSVETVKEIADKALEDYNKKLQRKSNDEEEM